MEDKPRTDLGQAEDKKGLAKGSRGKVQFYQFVLLRVGKSVVGFEAHLLKNELRANGPSCL